MRKIALLFLLVVTFSGFYSCRDMHSEAFRNMEKNVQDVEKQILDTDVCDDLQLFSFSILGLKTDLENLQLDESVSEAELVSLSEKVTNVEASLNGKLAALGCTQATDDESEINTSGEDEYVDFNIL